MRMSCAMLTIRHPLVRSPMGRLRLFASVPLWGRSSTDKSYRERTISLRHWAIQVKPLRETISLCATRSRRSEGRSSVPRYEEVTWTFASDADGGGAPVLRVGRHRRQPLWALRVWFGTVHCPWTHPYRSHAVGAPGTQCGTTDGT